MTTIQQGDRAAAAEYRPGEWVQITRHSKAALVGQVARVRSITAGGLLSVERPGRLEGDLVNPNAVERYLGEPPAREREPLADELPAPVAMQPQGVSDADWQRIRAEAAPAVAYVTGRQTPAMVTITAPPAVEELAEDPVLLDQRPAVTGSVAAVEGAPTADRNANLAQRADLPTPRRTQSDAHKRAIQEGKARKKAEREAAGAATVKEPGIALAAERAQRRADELTAAAEPARLAREAAARNQGDATADGEPPAATRLDPTVRPMLNRTEREMPRDLRPYQDEARMAGWDVGPAVLPAVYEFDQAQGARQLLMDALAARQPVLRLNPLIDWLQQLEQAAS